VWRDSILKQAHVADDGIQGHLRTNGDGVRVHQAAGGILGEGEGGLYPLAVLPIQGVEDLAGDVLG
jgi:hypothetical protein